MSPLFLEIKFCQTMPGAERSRQLSESSGHGTGDLPRDEDEQLDEDVMYTHVEHIVLTYQFLFVHAGSNEDTY